MTDTNMNAEEVKKDEEKKDATPATEETKAA